MPYFVVTRTYIDDESVRDAVLKLSASSSNVFRKQAGFIEMSSLYAENKTHISTYMVWENQKSHLDCMESKDFSEFTGLWTSFIENGQIRFELETYLQLQ